MNKKKDNCIKVTLSSLHKEENQEVSIIQGNDRQAINQSNKLVMRKKIKDMKVELSYHGKFQLSKKRRTLTFDVPCPKENEGTLKGFPYHHSMNLIKSL